MGNNLQFLVIGLIFIIISIFIFYTSYHIRKNGFKWWNKPFYRFDEMDGRRVDEIVGMNSLRGFLFLIVGIGIIIVYVFI